jgi:hypothetical protein
VHASQERVYGVYRRVRACVCVCVCVCLCPRCRGACCDGDIGSLKYGKQCRSARHVATQVGRPVDARVAAGRMHKVVDRRHV